MKINLLLAFLFITSTLSLEWEQLCTKGNPPPGAVGSSLVAYGGQLFSFGGGQECPSKNITGNTTVCTPNVFFNDIYVCDLDTDRWDLVNVIGIKPPARSFHRSVAHKDTKSMYMYGGVTYQTFTGFSFVPFGDFWKFNFQTLTWTQINNTSPGIRVDPGFTIDDNDNIYLGFGLVGLFPQIPEAIVKNDLWKYHIPDGTWTLLIPNDPYHNVTGLLEPNVRYQCRMDFNKKQNKIYLYGGDVLPDNTRTLCDLWSYDIDTNSWELLDNCSVQPLFTGASATYKDNYFILTGEQRGPPSVPCTDPDNGKSNTPVNLQYVFDVTRKNSSFAQIRGNPDIINLMQSGYTMIKNKVYISLGLEFFCLKSGLQGGSGLKAVQKYPTIVWSAILPD